MLQLLEDVITFWRMSLVFGGCSFVSEDVYVFGGYSDLVKKISYCDVHKVLGNHVRQTTTQQFVKNSSHIFPQCEILSRGGV